MVGWALNIYYTGRRVCALCRCVCKAHSFIDLVVSQCNRSFCYVVVCKVIYSSTGGRVDGGGEGGGVDEAGLSPRVK